MKKSYSRDRAHTAIAPHSYTQSGDGDRRTHKLATRWRQLRPCPCVCMYACNVCMKGCKPAHWSSVRRDWHQHLTHTTAPRLPPRGCKANGDQCHGLLLLLLLPYAGVREDSCWQLRRRWRAVALHGRMHICGCETERSLCGN